MHAFHRRFEPNVRAAEEHKAGRREQIIITLRRRTPRIAASAYIAPSADIIGSVEIGENASIWFQCVLRGDVEAIRIGANSNVQDGSVIHTLEGAPAVIGDWVTVGHGVILHGCTVEDHCLIGIGAVLLNHVRVGKGSIVAAGAVVLENTVIPPRSLYAGVPAKLRRKATAENEALIRRLANNYLQYKKSYQGPAAKSFGSPQTRAGRTENRARLGRP